MRLFVRVAAGSETALLSHGTSGQRRPAVEVMEDNYHEGDFVLSKINCADSDRRDPLAIVHYCTGVSSARGLLVTRES